MCSGPASSRESANSPQGHIRFFPHFTQFLFPVFAWQEAPGEQWTDLYEACGERCRVAEPGLQRSVPTWGSRNYEDSKPVKDDAEFCTNKTLSYCTSVEPTPGRCTEEQ